MKPRKELIELLEAGNIRADEYYFQNLSAPPLLSFIPMQDILYLNKLARSIALSAKIDYKYEEMDRVMERNGFVRMGRGTNRACYRHLENKYVCMKVAVDDIGIRDNPREFINQDYLYPFVCKVFEVDPTGTVALVERVNPITNRDEFASISDKIFDLIRFWFTGKYVMEDIGCDYFMNWGTRMHDGCPVLLDYPYMYELDYRKVHCNRPDIMGVCGGEIDYDDGYNRLVCTKCGAKYKATELSKTKSNLKVDKEAFTMDLKVEFTRANGDVVNIDTSKDCSTKSVLDERYEAAQKFTAEISRVTDDAKIAYTPDLGVHLIREEAVEEPDFGVELERDDTEEETEEVPVRMEDESDDADDDDDDVDMSEYVESTSVFDDIMRIVMTLSDYEKRRLVDEILAEIDDDVEDEDDVEEHPTEEEIDTANPFIEQETSDESSEVEVELDREEVVEEEVGEEAEDEEESEGSEEAEEEPTEEESESEEAVDDEKSVDSEEDYVVDITDDDTKQEEPEISVELDKEEVVEEAEEESEEHDKHVFDNLDDEEEGIEVDTALATNHNITYQGDFIPEEQEDITTGNLNATVMSEAEDTTVEEDNEEYTTSFLSVDDDEIPEGYDEEENKIPLGYIFGYACLFVYGKANIKQLSECCDLYGYYILEDADHDPAKIINRDNTKDEVVYGTIVVDHEIEIISGMCGDDIIYGEDFFVTEYLLSLSDYENLDEDLKTAEGFEEFQKQNEASIEDAAKEDVTTESE